MTTEKTSSQSIPSGISNYINEHFREDFLTQSRTIKDINDKTIYLVDVSQDETLYHLKFNESGVLIDQVTEPLLELPDDDLTGFDD